MATSGELFWTYTAGPHVDPEATVALFTENGATEAPFFTSLGFAWRFVGRENLLHAYGMFYKLYEKVHFENARLIVENGDVAVGEYEFIATSKRTGRTVYQLTSATLFAEGGRIKRLREFQNIAETACAIMPNGPADIKVSDERDLKIGQYW